MFGNSVHVVIGQHWNNRCVDPVVEKISEIMSDQPGRVDWLAGEWAEASEDDAVGGVGVKGAVSLF